MNIKNEDLEFLIHLENKMGEQENWSEDVMTLWKLIERLQSQREVQRLKCRTIMAERRILDKNYSRGKKSK